MILRLHLSVNQNIQIDRYFYYAVCQILFLISSIHVLSGQTRRLCAVGQTQRRRAVITYPTNRSS